MLGEMWGIEWLFWWQFILLAVLLPLGVFGGGALLWVGGRFCAKAPKATYWRSVGTNVLAGPSNADFAEALRAVEGP